MNWRLLLLLLALCFVAAPARSDDDTELAGWKQRLEQAQQEVVKAREQVAAAHTAYANMRHDRSMRGQEKAKVIAARAESEHALSDAQARLDALREEARGAGVPPAWMLPDPPPGPSSEP